MKLSKLLSIVLLTSTALAQTPPAQEKPVVALGEVRLENASLPGSSLVWTKIIVSFTSEEKWTDGIAFNALALLGSGQDSRVVTGSVRYSNIPAGRHQAILYLSPRAIARFGAPIFIEVTAFHKDAEVAQASWKNPLGATTPPEWRNLNTYNNVLVPVTRTPWILLDYEKAPDIASN